MKHEVAQNGWALSTSAVAHSALERLLKACVVGGTHASLHHTAAQTYGVRGLLWSSPSLFDDGICLRHCDAARPSDEKRRAIVAELPMEPTSAFAVATGAL